VVALAGIFCNFDLQVNDMPLGTPFHSRTSAFSTSLNWRIWSGYYVASSYDLLHEYEYHAIRNTAALIDISPLFKYDVTGKDALKFVDRLTTRNVGKCAIDQAVYTCLCNHHGKVIQDGTIFRLGEKHFRFNLADPSLRWFQMNGSGLDIEIHDRSEEIAVLALQGPGSRQILRDLTDDGIEKLKFFRLNDAQIDAMPALISRTGYTGDLGYEIWVSTAHAEKLWDLCMQKGKAYGITPAGMLALDMARIEAGFVLIEVDYISAEKALIPSQTYTPFEVGLEWTVDLKKEYFVGQKALKDEKAKGPRRRLVGLMIDLNDFERLYHEKNLAPQVPTAAWRGGLPVFDRNDRQVGRATSGVWSPILKKYIALATVEAQSAGLGTSLLMEVTVEYERKKAGAVVTKLPFYDPPRKRA